MALILHGPENLDEKIYSNRTICDTNFFGFQNERWCKIQLITSELCQIK